MLAGQSLCTRQSTPVLAGEPQAVPGAAGPVLQPALAACFPGGPEFGVLDSIMQVVRVRCKLESADDAARKKGTLRERIIVLEDLQGESLRD